MTALAALWKKRETVVLGKGEGQECYTWWSTRGSSTNFNMPRLMLRVGWQVIANDARWCVAGQKSALAVVLSAFFVTFVDSIRLIGDLTIFSISRGCAEPQKGCSLAADS